MILTREQALEIFKRRVSVRYYTLHAKSVPKILPPSLTSDGFRPAPSAANRGSLWSYRTRHYAKKSNPSLGG